MIGIIIVPSEDALDKSVGSSCREIKSDARKFALTRATATLALSSAPRIASFHCAPATIFVSSHRSMMPPRSIGER
jgi:hypothetical protein